MSRLRAAAGALALFLVFGCGGASEQEWPQWRGPDGAAVAEEGTLPTRWDVSGGPGSENLRWRAEVPGEGNSSPIVVGGRVYLTTSYPSEETPEPPRLHWRSLLAFDVATGERLWERRIVQRPAEKRHSSINTLAGPTPAGDGDSVYVYFGSDVARVRRDGTIAWQVEIDPSYAAFSRYGAASSPVLAGELLLVVQDQEYGRGDDVGWMAALDRDTGERVWRIEWDHTCCSYSTPLVVDRGAGPEILLSHSGGLASYDLETGERLWDVGHGMLQMVSTPILEGDLLIVLGGADRRRGNSAWRLQGAGAETRAELLWEAERLAPQASSPVLYRGILFSVTQQGVLVAYQPETGEILWQERLRFGRNHASLVAGDGKVYVSSMSGNVSVVRAAAEFELLAVNEAPEPGTAASPALGDGCFLQRTRHHLWCFAQAAAE